MNAAHWFCALPPLNQIMVYPPSVAPQTPLQEAVELLYESQSPCVLVCEQGCLLGVIHERVVLQAWLGRQCLETAIAADVMTSDALLLSQGQLEHPEAVLRQVQHYSHPCVIVVDEQHRPLGALTPEQLGQALQCINPWEPPICDRQEVENRLRLMESVVLHASDAVLITDGLSLDPPNPKIVFANQAMLANTGFALDELIGKTPRVLQGPKTDPSELNRIRSTLANQEPVRAELINYRKDGSEFWVELQIVPILDDLGTTTHFVSIQRDISHRKQIEQALQRSHDQLEQCVQERTAALQEAYQQLSLLIDSSPLAVIEWNHDLQVQSWSGQASSIFGWTASEVVGKQYNQWPFIYEADLPDIQAAFQTLRRGDTPHLIQKHRLYTRDGTILHCEWYSSALIDEDGNLISLLTLVHDVSDRHQAEQALRDSESLYQTLIANFPNGLVQLFDADLRYILTDGQGLADLGLTRQDFEGKTLQEALDAETAALLEPLYHKVLEGRTQVKELTWKKRIYALHLVPIRGEAGEVVAGMVMAQNITPRKRIEEALIQARHELEMRVQDRTQELWNVNAYLQTEIIQREQLTQELQRSNQELEQFAYIASHDLQEPLRAITSYTQLLAKRYDGQLDERADKYIHYITDGATRMQRLITDLLTYSRVGRHQLKLTETDLNHLLEQVLQSLEVTITESQARVTSDRLPRLMVDAGQIAQLWQNLISNAIKYCEVQPQIHISVYQQVDVWHFTMQDNGIGIDPQYSDRIFVIFQRLHTRREYSGTGIGLAICKKIVERHGGSIWVESIPGQGSTFHFTLPITDEIYAR